jgi:hypothetical protein
MKMDGQHYAPTALPQGKTRYPLYLRLPRPEGLSGRLRKYSSPQGFDPQTVQPVASYYTNWAIPALNNNSSSSSSSNIRVGVEEEEEEEEEG